MATWMKQAEIKDLAEVLMRKYNAEQIQAKLDGYARGDTVKGLSPYLGSASSEDQDGLIPALISLGWVRPVKTKTRRFCEDDV